MDSVKDKVVLITGASSGIGAATAVEFAKYGSRLVLTGRNVENLNNTAEQCQAQGLDKDKILLLTGDVSIDENLTRIVDTAVSKFSTIDILINNAAISIPEDMQSPSVDILDTTYKVNLRAVVLLTKLVIPHLKKNKGSVVNVTSVVSTKPLPSIASYGMMKAALDMFTKDLALELAKDGVRVNSVSLGAVRTPIHSIAFNVEEEDLHEYYKGRAEITPLGRVSDPEDITQSIVFLASEASAFTTGAILDVDGGIGMTAAWTPRTILEQEK